MLGITYVALESALEDQLFGHCDKAEKSDAEVSKGCVVGRPGRGGEGRILSSTTKSRIRGSLGFGPAPWPIGIWVEFFFVWAKN